MSSILFEAEPPLPSEEFTRQVKELLENLHDFGYLQNHALSSALDITSNSRLELGWELVRKELLLAIETLSPGLNPPISSPRARLYHILNLHYLEEIPLQQCAVELGVSIRQTNRELRRAEQSVAAILWSKVGARLRKSSPRDNEHLFSEVEQLRVHFEAVDMGPLVIESSQEVDLLAREHGCQIRVSVPEKSMVVLTDRMIARQALISIFSRLVQSAHPGDLQVEFYGEEETLGLRVIFQPANRAAWNGVVEPFFEQLLKHIEWKLVYLDESPVVCQVIFEANAPPTLLVIDDNEGLGLLLERYLSGRRCRLVTARSGVEGLDLAGQLEPDAIMLDVMMPGMDGWQVLNRLKSGENTREIPVIICSVFNDPRLARSLGAALLLPKPLNRDEFMTAIRQVGL